MFVVDFFFNMEKTSPVLILTKCILHMCGASVSAVGLGWACLLLSRHHIHSLYLLHPTQHCSDCWALQPHWDRSRVTMLPLSGAIRAPGHCQAVP